MILGIGSDLVNIPRIQHTLNRFGDRFENRVFTKAEQNKAQENGKTASIYAKRWAAKEACVKALGTGISKGITWTDIEVINKSTGQPTLHLTGNAAKQLKTITPAGYVTEMFVTMTDDDPWAQAFVVIEALRDVRYVSRA